MEVSNQQKSLMKNKMLVKNSSCFNKPWHYWCHS